MLAQPYKKKAGMVETSFDYKRGGYTQTTHTHESREKESEREGSLPCSQPILGCRRCSLLGEKEPKLRLSCGEATAVAVIAIAPSCDRYLS